MKLRALLSLTLIPLLTACPGEGGDDAASDSSSSADPSSTAGSSSADAADDTTMGDPGFDAAEVIAMGSTYATTLEKINVAPFPSQHGAADMVNVYINADAAALFRSLDPAAPAEVALPEGTLIVKEHLNTEGAFDGYLLMYRGPDGYAPDTGDWFWAATSADGGTLSMGPSGPVDFCINCHTPAPSLVFGVEADNQT